MELNTIRCCDCLDGMRELESKSIDLVITDPPYGIGDSGKNNQIYNCEWEGNAKLNTYHKFDDTKPTQKYFDEILRISKNQIIFGVQHFTEFLPQSPAWIVWDKEKTGFMGSGLEIAWTSFNHSLVKFSYKWQGMIQGDMNHKEERVHPTQKPVKLFEWIIKNYAKEGDVICDPFFGSGSCLVAAVRMGHQFIGFEKETSYFEKAQIRIKNAQEQRKLEVWFGE